MAHTIAGLLLLIGMVATTGWIQIAVGLATLVFLIYLTYGAWVNMKRLETQQERELTEDGHEVLYSFTFNVDVVPVILFSLGVIGVLIYLTLR